MVDDTSRWPGGPPLAGLVALPGGPHPWAFYAAGLGGPFLVNDAVGRVSAWEAGGEAPRWSLPGRCVGAHPRRGLALAELADGALALLDARDGTRLRTLAPADPSWTRCSRMAAFLDGDVVTFLDSSVEPFRTVTIVDLDDATAPPRLQAVLAPRALRGLSAEGRTAVLVSSAGRAQRVEGCDVATLAPRWRVDLAAAPASGAGPAWVDRGLALVERAAAGQRWVHLDASTGAVRAEVTLPAAPQRQITAAPDGRTLALVERAGRTSPERWRVSLAEVDGGDPRPLVTVEGRAPAVHFTCEGRRVLVHGVRLATLRDELLAFDRADARPLCAWTLPAEVVSVTPDDADGALVGARGGLWRATCRRRNA
jgi:hypothetical protein